MAAAVVWLRGGRGGSGGSVLIGVWCRVDAARPPESGRGLGRSAESRGSPGRGEGSRSPESRGSRF